MIQATVDYLSAWQMKENTADIATANQKIEEIEKFFRSKHFTRLTNLDGKEVLKRIKEIYLAGVKCFSSKITCACCQGNYVSNSVSMGGKQTANWACYAKIRKKCSVRDITEKKLKTACCEVLHLTEFDENVFAKNIHNILVFSDGRLEFTFYDGTKAESHVWFYNSEDRKYKDPHSRIYGYTRIEDTYIICEEEAEAVRMVYEDYLNEMTISDISRKMESLGYHGKRTGFSRKMVLYLLSNPFYIGTRIYPAAYSGTGKDEIVENDHPAIVTREQFEKARERREYYAKRHEDSRNHKQVHSTAD